MALFIIIIVCFICIILYTFEQNIENKQYSLENDGFVLVNNQTDVHNFLPHDYMFIDYVYEIKGCTLQTYHRDVTSSQYILNTQHPVYTYIEYYTRGPVLTVCPGSHKTTPLTWSSPKILTNNSNDKKYCVLFNCDLVHCGALPDKEVTRHLKQYKIVHKDDFNKLKHLVGINKLESHSCKKNNKIKEIFLRKLSLIFCYPINHIFTKYLQENQNNILNKLGLFIIGKSFYNK